MSESLTEHRPEGPELFRDVDWQRLDVRMLLVHPMRELIRFIPVLIGILVAGGTEGPWQLFGIGLPIALGVLRYLTTSFRIAAGRVELRHGLISRHTLSTPLDRVRTVDVTASPIHRILGLTRVQIGTGSSSKDHDEALELDGLPVARARELRRELLAALPTRTQPGVPGAADDATLVRFDLRWLRYAPLTGNGLVIAAAVVGGGSQLLNAVGFWRRADPSSWSLPGPTGVAIVVAVVAALLIVAGLSVAGYLVTDAGFTLTHGAGAWHVRRGLTTTRETTLDEARVSGVSLAEPLTLRWVGAAQVHALVSGVAHGRRGSAVLVPPAPAAVARRVAAAVVGAAADVELLRHGSAATRRRWTRALVPTLLLVAVLVGLAFAVGSSWWLLPVPVVLVVAVVLAADRVAGLGHALVDGRLVARSGSLARRRDVLGTEHVIGWTFRSSLFQRRLGLTTLSATTAGGRRQHVSILDLPETDAVTLAADAVPGLVAQFARGSMPA